MGGLFGGSTPTPAPAPARPVTAVTKTPDIELEDTELQSEGMARRRRGKKALRVDMSDTGIQIPKPTSGTASGVQVPK